uniref:ABC transporter permease n=1 Tax=Chloracidobacterium thermophilum TaxID=458033 RepID=UPI00387EBF32
MLQYLLPLLIIVLAFDALAGEREHGTLRYLLSLGVRPGRCSRASWPASGPPWVWRCCRLRSVVSCFCGGWRMPRGISSAWP